MARRTKLLCAGEELGGEGLVEVEQVDVGDACLGQSGVDRRDGPMPILVGSTSTEA